MFLNLGADFPVYFGTVSDISGVVGKNGVDCVRVALMRLDDCFIGEKFIHTGSPPFPSEAVARQAGYAAPLCCVSGRYVRRSLSAAGAGSNSGKFLPVPAPAKGQGQRQVPHGTERRSGRRR